MTKKTRFINGTNETSNYPTESYYYGSYPYYERISNM
jgi:hypothetical protein